MAVLQKFVSAFFILTLLAASQARVLDDTWIEGTDHMQLLNDSTMAERAAAARVINLKAVADNPHEVAANFEMIIRNSTLNHISNRRKLGFFSGSIRNVIDDCEFRNRNWSNDRKALTKCSRGFGANTLGGVMGRYYVVTDPNDYDAVHPRPGTLRHAVIQLEPLWIVFDRDMVIKLKEELIMTSLKTIDGRGVNVHIAHGACLTIQYVSHIIVHGIHIHDCYSSGNAMVSSSVNHYGWRTISDGDGISIFGSSNIWIDHNSLSNCKDGLIDAIMGSTAITISNNHFTNHNEVMLMGHSDSYTNDKIMQVTFAFNHFGENLIQRMPRCRHGFFHVINNDYTHWEKYAIGSSAKPTIVSGGNRYSAGENPFSKMVVHYVDNGEAHVVSIGDEFRNGARFVGSGEVVNVKTEGLWASSVAFIHDFTKNAGAGHL